MKRKVTLIAISFFFSVFSLQCQTWFGPQKVIISDSTNVELALSTYSVDIDGDGDMDVLSASESDDKIAWYENYDGNGNFNTQQIISTNADGARSVFACDIDGDGDMDVLSASYNDNKIAWYENTDGSGAFGSQQTISTSAMGAYAVFASDIDGDGDMDVISAIAADDKIAWYENTDGNGTFGIQQIITTATNGASSVYAIDIDGDGDMDVLSASLWDNKIAWYRNMDGNGAFGLQQIISTIAIRANSVYATDIDGDGDMDILSASIEDNKIAWYENTDGNGTFSPEQIISTSAVGAFSVFASDIDNDGDIDVLSASSEDDNIAWYKNTDGNGTFGPQLLISANAEGASSVYTADLDGDGDEDVLSSSFYDNKIAWHENEDGNGTFGPQQIIPLMADGARSVYVIDIEGDGDMDILSASFYDNKIAWYENADGSGSFMQQRIISTVADGATSVFATDIDGDGNIDVLSASRWDNKIAWYKNTDGNGTFGPQQVISTIAEGARFVYAADIDGDEDMDVLSASFTDGKIAWYENTDGNGLFGPQQIILTYDNAATSVYASDIDGDGDMDVLSSQASGGVIVWNENIDGSGTFGQQQIVSASGAESVCTSDIDGDGDEDVVSASFGDNKIAWSENIDGNGTFGPQQTVTTNAEGAVSVYTNDIDGDGDMDVLSASWLDNKIAWYENTDGNGTFGSQQIITSVAYGAMSVFAADIDGDGDIDVLSASIDDDKIAWYENMTIVGMESFPKYEIAIYPNPTTGKITLDNLGRNIRQLKLTDLAGKVLFEESGGNPTETLDMTSFPSGVYILSIQTDKVVSTSKIIKQ